MWQLEPTSRLSARERTTSTTSTASTHSSYAFISDPDISSSFAASLESGQVSDVDDLSAVSPGISSPTYSSGDELRNYPYRTRANHPNQSNEPLRPVSPRRTTLRSMTSSFTSSFDSLHLAQQGRLFTLHLEKEQSIIWPSLVVGPCPTSMASLDQHEGRFDASLELEHQYNMDPTSLVLIASDLLDLRAKKNEAFEYFL
jgi:hypothetical protein